MRSTRRRRHRLLRDRYVCGLACRRRGGCRRGRRFSYKSSRVFFLLRQPVALKLVEMAQGFEIAHAVEINSSHQVIELVLDHSRKETFSVDLDLVSLAIQ